MCDIPSNVAECHDLAMDYLHGRNGKPKNVFSALLLLHHSAKSNYHKSQRELGILILSFTGKLFESQRNKALVYIEIAALHKDPIAIKYMCTHKISKQYVELALSCEFISSQEFESYLKNSGFSETLQIRNVGKKTPLYATKVAIYLTHLMSMIPICKSETKWEMFPEK